MHRSSRGVAASLLFLMTAGAAAMTAQNAPAPPEPAPASVTKESGSNPNVRTPEEKRSVLKDATRMRRFYFGVKAGYNFFNPINAGSGGSSDATTNPIVQININSTSSNRPIMGGVWVEGRVYRNFFLDVEATYHLARYDSQTVTYTTVVNGATSVTLLNEHTKLRYLDVPVLVRWYNHGSRDGRYKFFANIGATARQATQINTATDSTTDSYATITANTPAVPLHNRVIGYTAGAGMRGTDDFGIKVQPEIRYTRWAQRVFSASPTTSRADEMTVSLGFTF